MDIPKFSSVTLSTPPELLRDTQRFYREVNSIHDNMARGDTSVSVGIKKLQEQIDYVEQSLFPRLDKSIGQIKKELEQTDIIL